MQNKPANKTPKDPGPDIKHLAWAGILVLVVFVGGAILWASFSKLESAAITPGKITVASNRKVIEHLEGGITRKVFAKEGDLVKKGDPLLKLDDTQTRISRDLLQEQVNELSALEARLIAERDDEAMVTFPKALLEQEKTSEKAKKVLRSQRAIFKSQQQSMKGRISIYNQRIEEYKNEIKSLESQFNSQQKQLDLINREIKAVAYLEKKKFVPLPMLLKLQREAAKLTGNRDERSALIARTRQKIGETQLEIIQLKENSLNGTLKSLRETQKDLSGLKGHLEAAQDIHERTLIIAPKQGRIVGLRIHTLGAVISPGEAVMEIVPDQDELIVEARLNPLDIDVVHDGLLAKIRLLAYKQRHTPVLDGKVIYVSADSLFDPITKQPYYLVRIRIDLKDLNKLKGVDLYPGMPVQAMIITANRTALDYFLTPIKESFSRAFLEK